MSSTDQDLWKRIDAFDLDDPAASLAFSDRLARENGWGKEYSLRVIEEYKRFMFLLCVTNEPLTPSDQVDQAWHLHLIYTRSYWKEFCGAVLGREIHHGPTVGGAAEQTKFTDWYARTKESYAKHFDAPPPLDIWPGSTERFAAVHFQRVDRARHLVIRLPFSLRR
ncbi:MAG: hypothetical protein JNM62_04400 [Flavobacteriales bacterium]|nr:hypothetical protein [Flavobacteriales bacterium]